MLMIVCFTAGTANAQFSKLKKLAKKAESVVKEKKNKESSDTKSGLQSVKAKVEEAKTKAQLEDYVKRTSKIQTL